MSIVVLSGGSKIVRLLAGPPGPAGSGAPGAPGAPGANSGTGANASARSAMAAISSPAANAPVILTEAGREGTFVWTPGNLSAMVTADTAQGIYVAPASDTTGASGAWVRKFSGPHNVKWFGAKGDGTTNDSAAFVAALAYLKVSAFNTNGSYRASSRLYIPAGHYYLGTTTLDVTHTLIIEGEGGAGNGLAATKLRWAANTTGVRTQAYNTSGATTIDGTPKGSGGWTHLRDLYLVGAYVNQGTTPEGEYHGIHAKQMIFIDNVTVEHFQGDGLYADGATSVNTDLSKVNNFKSRYNRDGRNITGNDANVWAFRGCSYEFNRRLGVNENGATGNLESDPYTNGNGVTAENDGVVLGAAVVSYSGNLYTVIPGNETGAQTNAPSGTTADNTWWYYVASGGASSGRPAWFSGMKVRTGGPYYFRGASAAHVVIMPYIEGTETLYAYAPTVILGGATHQLKGTAHTFGDDAGYTGLGPTKITGNFRVYNNAGQLSLITNTESGAALSLVSHSNATTQINFYSADGSTQDGFIYTSGAGGDMVVNGRTAARLRVNGSSIVDATSAGAAVTGNVSATGVYKVGANQVIGARDTGWTADTGTAEKTAHATYVAGTTLTFSATYTQSELTALATRLAAVETALQNATRGQKALKDVGLGHGWIGA